MPKLTNEHWSALMKPLKNGTQLKYGFWFTAFNGFTWVMVTCKCLAWYTLDKIANREFHVNLDNDTDIDSRVEVLYFIWSPLICSFHSVKFTPSFGIGQTKGWMVSMPNIFWQWSKNTLLRWNLTKFHLNLYRINMFILTGQWA